MGSVDAIRLKLTNKPHTSTREDGIEADGGTDIRASRDPGVVCVLVLFDVDVNVLKPNLVYFHVPTSFRYAALRAVCVQDPYGPCLLILNYFVFKPLSVYVFAL